MSSADPAPLFCGACQHKMHVYGSEVVLIQWVAINVETIIKVKVSSYVPFKVSTQVKVLMHFWIGSSFNDCKVSWFNKAALKHDDPSTAPHSWDEVLLWIHEDPGL